MQKPNNHAQSHKPTAHIELFARLLGNAVDKSQAVQAALEQEYRQLTGNDPQALQAAVAAKQQALLALKQALAERDSLQQSMGLPTGNAGSQALIDQLPASHPIHISWQALQQMAVKLAEQNRINGNLAAQCAERTRRALDILTGRSSEQSLYQPGGKIRPQRQSLSLAVA